MKEVVLISNPTHRQVWENMLGIAHFHLYSTYPISILLKPENAKQAVADEKVDIVLADIRELQNKKPDIKQKYIDCIIEIAKQIGLSNQKNLVKKRLAIFLPTKLDKQISKLIQTAFSYNVYDFFKMHYAHGKNSINVNQLAEQLTQDPNIVNGNKYVEMAQNILQGQELPTLDTTAPKQEEPQKTEDTDQIVQNLTNRLSGIGEKPEKTEAQSQAQHPTVQTEDSNPAEQANTGNKNTPEIEKASDIPTNKGQEVQSATPSNVSVQNGPAKADDSKNRDTLSAEDISKLINQTGPTRSAAISAFAKSGDSNSEKQPRVHKRRISEDTSQYDNTSHAEKAKKQELDEPWNKQFDTKKSLAEEEKLAKQMENQKVNHNAYENEPVEEEAKPKKKNKKKKASKKEAKKKSSKKATKKRSSAAWIIPVIILVGIALLFFCTKSSDNNSASNQNAENQTSKPAKSLNSYLENHQFADAVQNYPSKQTQIDNYILDSNDISNRKAAINEVYAAAQDPNDVLTFDHAYFNHKWETVTNNADVADTVQREVMLSASYMAIGDTQDAQKIADKANQPALNQLLQQYTQLTNTDNQIKSQLNQSGLDNNKRQQLQQTLDNNEKTIHSMINNL